MIDIPTITPLGKKITSVGIWMSGGADSTMLCYLLAKKIKDENINCKILPLTVDYKRPFQDIAVNAKKKISELLDADHIFLDHIVYRPKENQDWYGDTLAKIFHEKNFENFKANRIQVLYSGISTNPSLEVQKNFKWGILPEVEAKRGSQVVKEKLRYFTKKEDSQEYEFMELKPFFDIDKKQISEMYKKYDLTDSLFPMTRSCEKLGTSIGHCGECWWCEERRWAFGKL